MSCVTSCTLSQMEAVETIVPEPTESVREAIVEALRERSEPRDRWAAAVLREGVEIVLDTDE